ncbi:hypothetical protein CLOHYLEM_06879 [[Clostridium] hylemonae DSM 15053]|uniref:Uncharacterized protein n=1 Tax=[Clostridium] hylemonae DSM 15053 TaxID=553973 RepID=C0C464_9FIRM|nr:hypothetical protein CLOHYLEM_06879 [[Clostridium] hylemonae DSM 15053]
MRKLTKNCYFLFLFLLIYINIDFSSMRLGALTAFFVVKNAY